MAPLRRSLLALLLFLWNVAPTFADPLPVPPDIVHGTKWGSPILGTTGGTVTYSYDTSFAGEVPLSSFLPAGFTTDIDNAFAAWSAVGDITFVNVPSGGELRLVGFPIDGPGNVGANATFPEASYNRVYFDTGNTWSLGRNIRELAMHEIGHAIGLEHPTGVLARMDHRVTSAFDGLLPNDVAGIQAVYGPAAGSNPDDYAQQNVTTLALLPSSTITTRAFLSGVFDTSQATQLSGTLDARLAFGAGGAPEALTFYGSNVAFTDFVLSETNPLISVNFAFSNLDGEIMNLDWFGPSGQLTSIVGSQFSPLATMLGLVGGQGDFDVFSSILGIDISELYDFSFVNTTGAGPQALPTFDDGRLGQITRTGSVIDLTLPIATRTSFGDVTFETIGTIYAQAIVPEPSMFALASIGIATLLAGRLSLLRSRPLAAFPASRLAPTGDSAPTNGALDQR